MIREVIQPRYNLNVNNHIYLIISGGAPGFVYVCVCVREREIERERERRKYKLA